jgi:MFS family permease
VDRLGERPLIVSGMLLQAAGTAWIALIAKPSLAYAMTIAPMVLVGLGSAMAMPAAQKAVVGAVAPSAIGKASGTFTTMRWFGGVFGIAIADAVFAASGGYASAQAFNDGFFPATAVAAGFALAGAIAGTLIPARTTAISPIPPASPSPALETEAS